MLNTSPALTACHNIYLNRVDLAGTHGLMLLRVNMPAMQDFSLCQNCARARLGPARAA